MAAYEKKALVVILIVLGAVAVAVGRLATGSACVRSRCCRPYRWRVALVRLI
ncbi:MAG: hypothetical protein ABR903_02345 [Thermodesulfovibrionales bacterium]|jgi:hypothetical protein